MQIKDVFADIEARRGRWESGQNYWRCFVKEFLVGKRNFLFKGGDGKEILTEDSFSDVVKRYSSLREKNQIDSFKEEAKAQYGNAPRAVQMVLTHILYAYKLIERAETANAVNNKKEFVCCIGDLGELDPDLYWDGVAGTGSGYNKPGESVGFFLDALVHLAQTNKTSSFKEVNETILAFCEGRYNELQTGGKWMADVLFWYVAPDKYEPIISQAAKKQIARKLKGDVENHPEYSSDMIKDDFKVNKVISLIRQEFVKEGMRDTFNFYDEDVESLWSIAQDKNVGNNEQGFELWMRKIARRPDGAKYKLITIYVYKNALKNPVSRFAKLAIFEIQDIDLLDDVMKTLFDDDEFRQADQKINTLYPKNGSSKTMSNAIKRYREYLLFIKNAQDNGENAMTPPQQNPLNQIFYGPPGTGKTYHVIPAALGIIGDVPGGREAQMEKFNELRDAGQIAMVTFHQNFSYEDFIEGIKPVLDSDDNNLSYEMATGIFKEIAEKANENREARNDGNKEAVDVDTLVEMYATHVEDSDEPVFIGDKIKWRIKKIYRKDGEFRSFVLHLPGGEQSLGIRVIQRDYQRFELDEIKDAKDILPIRPSKRNVHGNNLRYLALFKALKEFKDSRGISFGKEESAESAERKNYVLIIDEINRGNISAIFGELITLLEDDKRLGRDFALRLELPYSKEKFGVPDNLHIIGTMNTADRSIAMLDTALRRRFHFVEMMPKPELLSEDVGGVNCRLLLEKINARIKAEYDREHQIGHAFLMGVEGIEDLKDKFQHKIIPLLQEYFFDDWEKIAKVLNKNRFIREEKQEGEDADKKLFELLPFGDEAWDKAENYQEIYKKKNLQADDE